MKTTYPSPRKSNAERLCELQERSEQALEAALNQQACAEATVAELRYALAEAEGSLRSATRAVKEAEAIDSEIRGRQFP